MSVTSPFFCFLWLRECVAEIIARVTHPRHREKSRSMLRRVRTASSLLFLVGAVGCFGEANAQGDVFACCGGNGPVTYGRSCDNISDDDAVQSGAQLVACWKHALAHFRNNTLDPDLHGVTIASQYQFFTIVLSSKNPVITPPPTANGTAVLQFSAEHDVGSRVMPDQNPGLGPVSYTHLTLPTNREV